MASRFRAARDRGPSVPEVEAVIVGTTKARAWPISIQDATCAKEGQEPSKDHAMRSHVEAAFYTVTNLGMRHDNEDRTIMQRSSCPSTALDFHMIGVLDGHDTSIASELVSKNLPVYLARKLKAEGSTVEEAYIATMADLEDKLKGNTVHPSAGTCALNCTVAGRFVWCGNLGDCRAALVNLEAPPSGKSDPAKKVGAKVTSLTWMSRDHKAGVPWEKQRIQEAGGTVSQDGRVEGLEPSRTLGDFDVKAIVKKGVISIIPEVRRAELGDGTGPAQAILICATDGVWDVLSGQDVCNLIAARKELAQLQVAVLEDVTGEKPGLAAAAEHKVLKMVAEDLVQFSIAKGSRDDCTAVVALISVAPA